MPLKEKERLEKVALLSAERLGFSSRTSKLTDNQCCNDLNNSNSAKTLPISENIPTFDFMARTFTNPEIKRGTDVLDVPKGSTKKAEQAKKTWHIEFYCFDPQSNKMKRSRFTDNLNRLKDPKEKELEAQRLCKMYNDLLEGGWSPFDEFNNEKLRKDAISIGVDEATEAFLQHHRDKGSRKKTIQSYDSKLKLIAGYFGNQKVNDIQDNDVLKFLSRIEKDYKWSPKTYNNAKGIYYGLFQFLILEKYIKENPFLYTPSRTVPKTEKHQVFKDDHFKTIMDSLKSDPYTDFFCKAIYYTCIRPKELRELQLKHIDLEKGTIFVPSHISKNKKDAYVNIDPNFRKELDKLDIDNYDKEFYLTGSLVSIIGKTKVGDGTPYRRFIAHLEKLKLLNNNYTLYSFKHTSNVKRFMAGWTLAEIMIANRHASLEQTENYLKDLTKFVDISKKEVPAI